MVTISDWNDLDAMRNDLTADYTLENDLDSSTAGYSGIGDDWTPLGFVDGDRNGNLFNGTLNGQGFQISDLVIEENSSSAGGVAFITKVDNGGLVENLSVDGTVDSTIADFYFGGLAGRVDTGTVQNCVSHVDVTASSGIRVGGLVGYNNDTVTDSYATGSVTGDDRVGGLVGENNGGTIQTSYAVGSVTGNGNVGGLVGADFGTVTDSYWDTEATGQSTSAGNATGLTTSKMQGDEASTNPYNMSGFDYSAVWDTVLTEDSDTTADGYPILSALDRQNQLEAQGIALVTVSESGAASAITTPTTIETTASIESGSATATATPVGTETTAFVESGGISATTTPSTTETTTAAEISAVTVTTTPESIETARAIEAGEVTARATGVSVETTAAIESGTTTLRVFPGTVEITRATEAGSLITQASPAVTSTAGVTIVRVAPRRTIDKQLRGVGRVLDLDES